MDRPCLGFEPHNCGLPGINPYAVRTTKTAKLQLCQPGAGPLFRSEQTRLGRRQFLGHARHGYSPRQSIFRASGGTTGQSGGDGLLDPACAVERVSLSPYRPLFETIWGAHAFDIRWPADVEQICSRGGPPSPGDPFPVHLSGPDRERATLTYDQIGLAIRAFESSPEVNAFTSKYDAVRAGTAKFTALERRGNVLFRGKARCNECHRDSGESPLFTDFTADNLGVPRNSAQPFYAEDQPDAAGYRVNPRGARYVDDGVGAFLASPTNPNGKWATLADSYRGKFQASSLRNVDKRPHPDFVKAYMHNGYFKSLKEVVHFYNTRDVLRRCAPNDPGEKVTCWPAPEQPANVNTTQMGHLGLTNAEEDAIVAFLGTLSDGYEAAAP